MSAEPEFRQPASSIRTRLGALTENSWVQWAAGVVFAALVVAAEGDLDSLLFTFVIAALILSLCLFATRKFYFSLFMMASLLSLSTAVSMAKRKFLGMNAHVFDVWFYLSKPDTLIYLADEFRLVTVMAVAALAAFAALATFVYRIDRRLHGERLLLGLTACAYIALLAPTLPWEADNLSYHNRKFHFASSFFVSLSDIPRMLRPSPLADRLASEPPEPAFAASGACNASRGAPDIILTLSESAVPPAQIPGWKFDPSLQRYFESFDGAVHRARVETHGGGTWVTHTSVTTGLSMADFGWMRPYATMLLRERVHHGLAAAMAKCGYKTAIISPQSYNFVNEGAMLTSLGFQDYIDRDKLNAPSKHEEDSFYFGKALDYYAHHIKEDGRPLFLFVMTMAAHSPYDFRFAPERIARGEPFGNDAETDEYLRRLTFAQEDYKAFLGALGEFRRPVLASQFGDHHPLITRDAFLADGPSQAMSDWRSKLFETFYALAPINFTPAAPMPHVEVLDLAYLGVTLMDTAGLPLDAVFQDKLALRALCQGAFHTCTDRAAVDRHLERMKASGLLTEPVAAVKQPPAHAN